MTAPVTASERDLRALAAIVSEDRPDVPDGEGLPLSLLADLMSQIRCDVIAFAGFDSGRQQTWSAQFVPDGGEAVVKDAAPVNWEHYWRCQPCSYPDRTGDLRSIVKIADFYSARQWHSIGTRCGINRPLGFERALMLALPAAPGANLGVAEPCGCSSSAGPALTSPSVTARCFTPRCGPQLGTRPTWMPVGDAALPPGLRPGNGSC